MIDSSECPLPFGVWSPRQGLALRRQTRGLFRPMKLSNASGAAFVHILLASTRLIVR